MSLDLPPPSADDLKEMPFTTHLLELRRHLVKIFSLIIVLFMSLAYFARDLYEILSAPLREQLPANATMIATDVTSPFMAPIRLTLFVAVFVGMPYILHQIWQFIAPGLYQRERRIAIPMLVSSVLLFYAGVAFAYYLALPGVLKFFILFSPDTVTPMTDIDSYLSFAMKLFMVFGLTFEIPIVTLLLILAGVVSVDGLVDKRRYIIVGCAGIAALITPPDGLSMIMLTIPMWLLFEIGLLFGRLLEKDRRARD
jgi:sec-independent protein translocase protein TatC